MENLRKSIGKRIGEVSLYYQWIPDTIPRLLLGICVDGFQLTFDEFSDEALYVFLQQ